MVAVCVGVYLSGLRNRADVCSEDTGGTISRAKRVFCQAFSTNMVHTWMLFSYPSEELRWSTVIIVAL